MARMRVFIVLVLALTAGGALAFATYNYVQKRADAKTGPMPTKPVVVAATDLDIGAELTQGQRPGHRLAGQRRAGRTRSAIRRK